MNGRVASGCPTGANRKERAMIEFTYEDLVGVKLHLRMTAEAKVRIPLREHLVMD